MLSFGQWVHYHSETVSHFPLLAAAERGWREWLHWDNMLAMYRREKNPHGVVEEKGLGWISCSFGSNFE